MVTEYLTSKNLAEAVGVAREMKAPSHFLPELLSRIMVLSLDRPGEDEEHASALIHALRAEGLVSGDDFMRALLCVLDRCPEIEPSIPLVKSYLAQFAARAVIAELVGVAELARPLENGTHFPLFLLCLQQAARLKDGEWLADLFAQSKVDMQKMLPGKPRLLLHLAAHVAAGADLLSPAEMDQNKERMLEILEGRSLGFLFPLLKLEKQLLQQIRAEPAPHAVYKWIKDNVSPKLHADRGFVNILVTR